MGQSNKPQAIFSKTVNSTSRTYFIDVRTAVNGNLFLTISESKKRKDGEGFERQTLTFFSDSAEEFFVAMDEASASFTKATDPS